MEFWLDTIDLSVIEKATSMGLLHGVTTNPSLLSKSQNPLTTVVSILNVQNGPLAVQVTELETNEMVAQGKKLYQTSPRIIVKVPVTRNGWEAMHILSKENIPVMATAIFHPMQALLAARAGASYVAPYFTRMLKAGDNPLIQIEAMKKMCGHYKLPTKIIAANPKTVEQVRACAELGIEAVTIREDLFADLSDTHELTAHAVEQFLDEWKNIHQTFGPIVF